MRLQKGTAARAAAALGVASAMSVLLAATALQAAGSPTAPGTRSGPQGLRGIPARLRRGPDTRIPVSPPTAAPGSASPLAPTPVPAPGAAPGTVAGTRTGAVANGSRASGVATYTQTFNWSGEFQNGRAITEISGSWTVPTVQPSSQLAMVSTWVGIGGMSTTAPLIQAGTISAQTTSGATYYSAWYEMLPAQSYTVTTPASLGGTLAFTVRPGDVMSVSLTNVGGNDWQVAIQDETAGWVYDHAFSYVSTESSAEWITERPTSVSNGRYSLYPLPDYGTTRFSNLQIASSHGTATPPTLSGAFAMFDTTGSVISAPGPVSTAATGMSFTDHYVKIPSRIYGPTAAATAAAELAAAFPSASADCPGPSSATRAVVLATDATYPDALASAYLASVLGTGTLLTSPTSLPSTTLRAIRDEGITRVFVVGGTLAVSQAVAGKLESTAAYTCGGTSPLPGTRKVQVFRIGGATAYDTAEMIAETPSGTNVGAFVLSGAYAGTNSSGGEGMYNVTAGSASATPASTAALPTAVLATGTTFQDAESASTLAYTGRLPILLTTPTSLSAQARSAIGALGIEQVIVMGGPDAVSDAVVSALEADGISVLRVAGADGTQTAVELAKCELNASSSGTGFGWPATGGVAVARGDFYSDGLAGAVVAADGPARTSPEPLLLTESPGTTGPYVTAFLNLVGTTGVAGKTVTHVTIFGGGDAITQGVANTLSLNLLG